MLSLLLSIAESIKFFNSVYDCSSLGTLNMSLSPFSPITFTSASSIADTHCTDIKIRINRDMMINFLFIIIFLRLFKIRLSIYLCNSRLSSANNFTEYYLFFNNLIFFYCFNYNAFDASSKFDQHFQIILKS